MILGVMVSSQLAFAFDSFSCTVMVAFPSLIAVMFPLYTVAILSSDDVHITSWYVALSGSITADN